MNARLFVSVILAIGVFYVVPPPDTLRWGLAIFVLAGSLWMTQAIPLSVTALLVPILATLSGLMPLPQALASFANPIIFLFLGGFALAAALKRQGLDEALAMSLIQLARGHASRAILYLFGASAFLSMWISNTAAVVIMLPLAMGLIQKNLGLRPQDRVFILLGIAYSGSIGGIGTLIGSPPNAIAAAQTGISFGDWLSFGLPLVVVLMPTMLVALYLSLQPQIQGQFPVARTTIVWDSGKVATLSIFGLTALGWIGAPYVSEQLGVIGQTDAIVAILAMLLLTITGTITWKEIESQCEWGILLLFGGGLALSQVMDVSGGSRYLATMLVSFVADTPVIMLTILVVAFVVFMTELVSNTASAALLIPIFISLSNALGIDPRLLSVATAVSASSAFMLPVATPPNAIVYATNLVPQSLMMRTGLILNLFSIVIIATILCLV